MIIYCAKKFSNSPASSWPYPGAASQSTAAVVIKTCAERNVTLAVPGVRWVTISTLAGSKWSGPGEFRLSQQGARSRENPLYVRGRNQKILCCQSLRKRTGHKRRFIYIMYYDSYYREGSTAHTILIQMSIIRPYFTLPYFYILYYLYYYKLLSRSTINDGPSVWLWNVEHTSCSTAHRSHCTRIYRSAVTCSRHSALTTCWFDVCWTSQSGLIRFNWSRFVRKIRERQKVHLKID